MIRLRFMSFLVFAWQFLHLLFLYDTLFEKLVVIHQNYKFSFISSNFFIFLFIGHLFWKICGNSLRFMSFIAFFYKIFNFDFLKIRDDPFKIHECSYVFMEKFTFSLPVCPLFWSIIHYLLKLINFLAFSLKWRLGGVCETPRQACQ